LTRPPAEITVGDIVRAVEGPVGLAPCVAPESCYGGRGKPKDGGSCPQAGYCAARLVWMNLSGEIERVLDETDLRQVLTDSQRLRSQAQ
jgi:Rrf2 family cysteine metabolism transcriptional repressor